MAVKKETQLVSKAEIRDLINLLKDTDVSEIEVESGGRRIRLRRGGMTVPCEDVVVPRVAVHNRAEPVEVCTPEVHRPGEDAGITVKAPIVGSFYRSPSPEAPPFVEVGSEVRKGQVLCIIEAMKLMNEIESEVDGRIRKILAETGEPVEYGQPLFVIEPL